MRRLLSLVLALLVVASVASAPLAAQYDYGPQSTMTFSGSGIPNIWVVTNSNADDLGVLIGLTAHQRYDNPALGHSTTNTFYATAGGDASTTAPAVPGYAMWNFGIAATGDNVAQYAFKLFYDFNPASGNTDFGSTFLAPTPFEDSYNLGMLFLSPPSPAPSYIFPPAYGTFDPTVAGQYEFSIVAYTSDLTEEIARTQMFVEVGDGGPPGETVPEPATMTLLATGLVGMAAARRRRKNQS